MPAITTPYNQATDADRILRIAAISPDGFQLNFVPNIGVIPDTWNLLGEWFLGSRTGSPLGEYVSGFVYANQQQWITQTFLSNFVDVTVTDLDVFRIRFRPYIPSGNVTVFTNGTITP